MATKKIKKVETPIDQRETFVSLQKTFGDSELSVEEKLKILYELQATDTQIDKIIQLRGELPAEVAELEADLAALNAKIASETELIDKFNKNIAAGKQSIIELDEEIAKYQKQLDNIANSREYDSINKEIENQGYLRQIAEKNITESRAAILDKKTAIETLRDTVEMREEDLRIKKEELAHIIESTAKEEGALVEKREEAAAKIDARTMSAYNRIRQSVHNHLAVVTVFNGDSCGGCFSTITPQRLIEIASGKKLIICEHCGRIIVNPDFE